MKLVLEKMMKKEYHEYRNVNVPEERSTDLHDSPVMAHLITALKRGQDIGDFGRLTFVMVARYFMEDEGLVALLSHQPSLDEWQARQFIHEISRHDYRPPTKEQLIEWNTYQEFPICPEAGKPETCDVYNQLEFPREVYEDAMEAQGCC